MNLCWPWLRRLFTQVPLTVTHSPAADLGRHDHTVTRSLGGR